MLGSRVPSSLLTVGEPLHPPQIPQAGVQEEATPTVRRPRLAGAPRTGLSTPAGTTMALVTTTMAARRLQMTPGRKTQAADGKRNPVRAMAAPAASAVEAATEVAAAALAGVAEAEPASNATKKGI